jgi:hypothetical protein
MSHEGERSRDRGSAPHECADIYHPESGLGVAFGRLRCWNPLVRRRASAQCPGSDESPARPDRLGQASLILACCRVGGGGRLRIAALAARPGCRHWAGWSRGSIRVHGHLTDASGHGNRGGFARASILVPVHDSEGGGAGNAQGGPRRRSRQGEAHRLVGCGSRVRAHRHREGLARLVGAERQRPGRGVVVQTRAVARRTVR